jgi:hypothetical protein
MSLDMTVTTVTLDWAYRAEVSRRMPGYFKLL